MSGSVFKAAAIIVAAVIAACVGGVGLGLVTVKFFFYLGAIGLLVLGMWTHRLFLALAICTIGGLAADHYFPGVLRRGQAAKDGSDQESGVEADLQRTPHEVPCVGPYFIGDDHHARYHSANREDPPRCYDWVGRNPYKTSKHPDNLEELVPQTPDMVARIKEGQRLATLQSSRATPSPATPSPPAPDQYKQSITPTPSPSPDPDRQLGQGPCCRR